MNKERTFTVDEETAQKNFVSSLKKQKKWDKINDLAIGGNTYAKKVKKDHEWALSHPTKQGKEVILVGPAAAG